MKIQNKFNKLSFYILTESKLTQQTMIEFQKACHYFNFLTKSNTNNNTYEWIYGNTTGFKLIFQNNYQNISAILLYNNKLIKKDIYIINDLTKNLNIQIANFIRHFLKITKQQLQQNNISNIDIEKLLTIANN